MQRETDTTRTRWTSRVEHGTRSEDRRAMYGAARKRPLSTAARAAARAARMERERALGPYEVSYDIQHGYGVERTIIQP